jgi:hypothetical protein
MVVVVDVGDVERSKFGVEEGNFEVALEFDVCARNSSELT